MNSRPVRLLALFLLAALAAWPARAENPEVSLRLENIAFAEAAAALGKAAGLRLALDTRIADPPPQVRERLAERATFDWTDARFAQALRQLCARYGLSPRRKPDGYELTWMAAAPPPPAPPAPVGLVEKDGVRLWPTRITISEHRQRRVDLAGGPPEVQGSGSMQVSLRAIMAGGDAERIAGIENLVAKDDRGNLLPTNERLRRLSPRAPFAPQFPDEWETTVTLPVPDPRAKKLEWLEGDLMVHPVFRRHALAFPLPPRGGTAAREVRELSAELTGFDPGEGEDGPRVHFRLFFPAGSSLALEDAGEAVALFDASGRSLGRAGTSSSGRRGAEGMLMQLAATFAPGPEPPAKAVLNLLERSQPVRLLSFRMKEIPLPPDGPLPAPDAPDLAARPARTPPPLRIARPPDRPFFQEGGGILVSRVETGGAPAGAGTLALGLARRAGDGWTALRWTDIEMPGGEEAARLQDLEPGTYRVLRVYRPAAAGTLAGPGRWADSERVVEVTAGKESVLPPLRWLPE